MKKVIVLGNGAREHVIGETLKRSREGVELFVYGGAKNPGLVDLSSGYEIGSLSDFDRLHDFVKSIQPDFVIPGPEAPIADGVVDQLAEMGVPSVAPMMTVARLESSKSFTRHLLEKYNIPGNPKFRVFYESDDLHSYIEAELEGQFVVKADGLKSGKGVKVMGDHFTTINDGIAYAMDCIESDKRVVVEEKFIGQEFSLMSFVDGETVLDMIPVQDHKRAYEGDKGPNTGGMGSYSDANHRLPFLTEQDLRDAHDITVQVARALREETGTPFKGVMYGGFIAVKDGVRLIEYNARFGDPEAMNCLSVLRTDFVDICEAIVRGELKGMKVEFESLATVCKYVVPHGYPDDPIKNEVIELGALPDNVNAYFASVDQREEGLFLAGSRAVAFVGFGDTIAAAERMAQAAAEKVKGPVFFREDIGTRALIQSRVEMMRALRG